MGFLPDSLLFCHRYYAYHHNVFTILPKILKLSSVSPPTLHFYKIILAILGSLHFLVNLRINFPVSAYKMLYFDGANIAPIATFTKKNDVLTVLRAPIQ